MWRCFLFALTYDQGTPSYGMMILAGVVLLLSRRLWIKQNRGLQSVLTQEIAEEVEQAIETDLAESS